MKDLPSHADRLDVAIIGAGPAGIVAAHRLVQSGLSVRLFEQLDRVGGRTRCATIANEVVNTGAMFVYVGSESAAICAELGIAAVPVSPKTYGIHLGDRTVIARDDAELLDGLALPAEARADLDRVIREVRAEYDAYTNQSGLSAASKRLASISMSEHLGPLHPLVQAIVDNAVKGGSTADPRDLSAQYALRYFASYLVRAVGHRLYLPEGMQRMSEGLRARLPVGALHLDAEVLSVDDAAGESYDLVVRSGGVRRKVRAKHVVFAVPGPGIAELAPWLPRWKHDAIASVTTNPTVTLAIALDSRERPEWDDIFVIACVGKAFNMVLQPRAAADIVPSRDGRTVFYCYLSADAEAALPGDDAAMTAAWLEDFLEVLPSARSRVLDAVLTRWERCFSFPAPGRDAVLADVRRPIRGLYFAGDYTSDTAGSHGAFTEGARAAREVREALTAQPTASAHAGS